MLTYVTRRLLAGLAVLWGTLTLIWLFVQAMPGNIVDVVLGSDRVVNATVRRNFERFYGLDDPLPVQYLRYLRNVVTFNFGSSQQTNQQVWDIMKQAVPTSARLAFWAMATYPIIAISAGVIAAVKRYSVFDSLSAIVSVALTAIPAFVMGIFLQWLCGVKTFQWGWPAWARLPVQWDQSDISFIPWTPLPKSGWEHLILPIITLSFVNLGSTTRSARTAMLEVLRADFMRTARSKGLAQRRVVFKHGLRNALIPIVTGLGADLIAVFGVAVLTETVFNIPGIGGRVAQAVALQDIPVIMGLCAIIVIATVLVSLAVDISYGWIDPRVRVENRGV